MGVSGQDAKILGHDPEGSNPASRVSGAGLFRLPQFQGPQLTPENQGMLCQAMDWAP